jgi:hypothetical protein
MKSVEEDNVLESLAKDWKHQKMIQTQKTWRSNFDSSFSYAIINISNIILPFFQVLNWQ